MKLIKIVCIITALSLSSMSCTTKYDIVITNATIYDGLGNEPTVADMAILDGKIVKIGSIATNAETIIDATGLIVSPGFIDMHTHVDRGIINPEGSSVKNYLTQGVTTVVTGNCGSGTEKVGEYFHRLDSIGIGPNVVHLIGQGSVRNRVMGMDDREPTAAELTAMKEIVAAGMQDGAVGMSTGLFYAPGSYSKTAEVIELTKTVHESNGIYTSHIRDESNYNIGLVAAVQEAIEIGEKAGVPVQISHLKALGTPVWGLSDSICGIIEAAQVRGVKVMADQYPYLASSTSLMAAVIPRWVQEGGETKARLKDPTLISKIKDETAENITRRGGPESLLIVSYQPNHAYDGLSLGEISALMNLSPVETAIDLVYNGSPSIVSFNMDQADLVNIMRKDYVMTSSDGSVQIPGSGVPHPRSYGTFPRKIRKYVIEDSVVTMAHAIRSATSMPAAMLGLIDRGVIAEGKVADLVIFNPKTIKEVATFDNPHQYSEGIEYLLVNGQVVIDHAIYNNKLAGKILKMNQYLSKK